MVDVENMRDILIIQSTLLDVHVTLTLLLVLNSGQTSGCTPPFTDCPAGCACTQRSDSFLVDCSSRGMNSWPSLLPNCTPMHIDISKNKLRELEYRDYMLNAVHIDARYNEISSISETFLTLGLSTVLETLLLDHNEFTTLSAVDVSFMKHVRLVSVHDNQWNCDCDIKDVYSWLKSVAGNASNEVHNITGIMCVLPTYYTQRAIVSLKREEICKTHNRKWPVWLPVVITISCVVYLIVISIVAICIVIRRRQKIVDVGSH